MIWERERFFRHAAVAFGIVVGVLFGFARYGADAWRAKQRGAAPVASPSPVIFQFQGSPSPFSDGVLFRRFPSKYLALYLGGTEVVRYECETGLLSYEGTDGRMYYVRAHAYVPCLFPP